LEVETVLECARGFARAVEAEDRDLISSYLSEQLKGVIAEVLGGLPRPIRTTEVLNVTPPEDERCTSLTRFCGFRGGVLLRALWTEPQPQQLLIRRTQIVDRNHPELA
jgi:hypothetical protein